VDPLPALLPTLRELGTAGALLVVLLALFRGWLVIGAQQQRLIDVYDKLIADKDRQIADWKAFGEAADRRGDLFGEALRDNTETLRTQVEVGREVQRFILGTSTDGRRSA